MCRHLFAALRNLRGRSWRMELMLQAQSRQLTRMEMKMAESNSKILARLEALQAQVTEHTTNEGNKLAEAVAAARAAQKTEDKAASDAELEAALAKIDEISKGLVEFNPSQN